MLVLDRKPSVCFPPQNFAARQPIRAVVLCIEGYHRESPAIVFYLLSVLVTLRQGRDAHGSELFLRHTSGSVDSMFKQTVDRLLHRAGGTIVGATKRKHLTIKRSIDVEQADFLRRSAERPSSITASD